MIFSRDGKTLATTDTGGTVGLWQFTNPYHPASVTTQVRSSPSALPAFGRDGRILATLDQDRAITPQVWDLSDPRHPVRLRALTVRTAGPSAPRAVTVDEIGLALSPDGRTLAVDTADRHPRRHRPQRNAGPRTTR